MSTDTDQAIKIFRFRWAGHVKRMNEYEIPIRILKYKPKDRRRVRRPKLS